MSHFESHWLLNYPWTMPWLGTGFVSNKLQLFSYFVHRYVLVKILKCVGPNLGNHRKPLIWVTRGVSLNGFPWEEPAGFKVLWKQKFFVNWCAFGQGGKIQGSAITHCYLWRVRNWINDTNITRHGNQVNVKNVYMFIFTAHTFH